MSRLQGKVVIAQGGGPTVVINQSLVGAVLEARKFPEVTRVWGARHGVRGIVNQHFIDLSEATTHNLERVAQTPSSALGSTRDKPDAEYCQNILNVFKNHEVRYFFYIGGNDSSDTVRIVGEYAAKEGYELRAIHIPKTVDNDLPVNDHCPGYPSAACFVAPKSATPSAVGPRMFAESKPISPPAAPAEAANAAVRELSAAARRSTASALLTNV